MKFFERKTRKIIESGKKNIHTQLRLGWEDLSSVGDPFSKRLLWSRSKDTFMLKIIFLYFPQIYTNTPYLYGNVAG
ncbi:MAG: hypothetical protein QQN41_05785 [Nitrosopumilus sp.]